MTLQQMRYVREIVREGFSISRAALALNITQPGLSRQIQQLEREIGVVVFVRHRKRLTGLSEPGAAVHRLATRMLLDAANVANVGREFAEEAQGTLTIATTHTQARYALPRVVQAFAKRYPKVSLRLRQGTPTDTARMVIDGTADLLIATAPIETAPGLVFMPCYELPRVILTPTRHPLTRERKLTLEKLAHYPLITYDYAFVSTSKVLAAFAQRGLTPTIVLNAIDADVIKTYVELGMGIAIFPAIAFDKHRDHGLRALPAGHLFEPNVIQVGLRRGEYLRGYTYAFIEMFAPHLTRARVERAAVD
jgi:LysR family cys regulon transcriptional activator